MAPRVAQVKAKPRKRGPVTLPSTPLEIGEEPHNEPTEDDYFDELVKARWRRPGHADGPEPPTVIHCLDTHQGYPAILLGVLPAERVLLAFTSSGFDRVGLQGVSGEPRRPSCIRDHDPQFPTDGHPLQGCCLAVAPLSPHAVLRGPHFHLHPLCSRSSPSPGWCRHGACIATWHLPVCRAATHSALAQRGAAQGVVQGWLGLLVP